MRLDTFFRRRARTRELERLIATQIAIATAPFDLEAVMATVVDEARELTRADAAVVELPDGKDMVYRAVAGQAEPYLGFRLRRASSISGLAVDTGEILSSPDTRNDPRVDREATELLGAGSLLAVPLMHDGIAAGVLKVYASRLRAFSEQHQQILAGLAQIIGAALVRAELMSRLEEQAITDELTGLPNRRSWYDRLDHAIARARRSGSPLSVIVLDLDGFKEVNDRNGHAAGDALLRDVSKRWRSVLREVDVLGRIGGDEFGVIAEGADGEAAAEIVRRLTDAGQHQASAGFATWDGAESASVLVNRADSRMYVEKRAAAAA